MKILYTFALAPLLIMALFQNGWQEDASVPYPSKGPYIKVTIDPGLKKYDCLKGFGICKMSVQIGLEGGSILPLTGGQIGGVLRKTNDQHLELTILKDSNLSTETEQKYLLSGIFRLEEGFTVPSDITDQLGLGTYHIPPGQYRVREDTQQYVVIF